MKFPGLLKFWPPTPHPPGWVRFFSPLRPPLVGGGGIFIFAFKDTISRHFAGYASVALETIWLHEPRDVIFLGPLMTENTRAHAQYGKCLLGSPHWRLKIEDATLSNSAFPGTLVWVRCCLHTLIVAECDRGRFEASPKPEKQKTGWNQYRLIYSCQSKHNHLLKSYLQRTGWNFLLIYSCAWVSERNYREWESLAETGTLA